MTSIRFLAARRSFGAGEPAGSLLEGLSSGTVAVGAAATLIANPGPTERYSLSPRAS
jgi:hypothetical protein